MTNAPLFQPLMIRGITLANRIAVSPISLRPPHALGD